MRKNYYFLLGILLLLTHSMLLSAAEIIVGQVSPFSGSLANVGNELKQGAQIYFDAINSTGGVHGNKIKFVTKDDGYKVDETLRLTKEMIATEKPIALLGLTGTNNIEALVKENIIGKAEIPVVGIRPGAMSLREPMIPYIFHVRVSYRDEVKAIIKYLKQTGIRKVAVFYQDDNFGEDGLVAVHEAAKAKQIELLGEAKYERNTTKVEDAVKEVAEINPPAVIMISTNKATAEFMRQLHDLGKKPILFGISIIDAQAIARDIGVSKAKGLGAMQIVPNPHKTINANRLVLEYRNNLKKFAPQGSLPSHTSLEGYLMAKVLVEGLRRAGSNPTSKKLMEALETINNYDTGGIKINYGKRLRSGSQFVELSVLSNDGEFLQ